MVQHLLKQHDNFKGSCALVGMLGMEVNMLDVSNCCIASRKTAIFFPGYKPFYILTFTSCFDVQKFFM